MEKKSKQTMELIKAAQYNDQAALCNSVAFYLARRLKRALIDPYN